VHEQLAALGKTRRWSPERGTLTDRRQQISDLNFPHRVDSNLKRRADLMGVPTTEVAKVCCESLKNLVDVITSNRSLYHVEQLLLLGRILPRFSCTWQKRLSGTVEV
jgi:hypothetical protein